MTTEDIKNLLAKAMEYTEKKFGKKADGISIEEDGTIRASWSTYVGCGEWENDSESFTVEELFNN